MFADLFQTFTLVPGEITSPFYWDCECENDYIHLKRESSCLSCGCKQEEMPDSIIDELAKYGFAPIPFGRANIYVNPD